MQVRPRKYQVPLVLHHDTFEPKARKTLRQIKGQKFRAASKGRQLSADERRAVEDQMREQGTL